jgi:hypothetical protein
MEKARRSGISYLVGLLSQNTAPHRDYREEGPIYFRLFEPTFFILRTFETGEHA